MWSWFKSKDRRNAERVMAAARFALQLGMMGNVRTRTLKAFPEAAYREIIASLG